MKKETRAILLRSGFSSRIAFGNADIEAYPLTKAYRRGTIVHFGFSEKSKWYQGIVLCLDDKPYTYSRGHWTNSESAIFGNGQTHRKPDTVDSPDKWHTLDVQLEGGTISFFYDKTLEWQEKAPPAEDPAGPTKSKLDLRPTRLKWL